jgi:hypothetical protein
MRQICAFDYVFARTVGNLTMGFARTVGNLTVFFFKSQIPGGSPGGDDRSWN